MWLDDVGCGCWVDFCFSCVVALLVGEGLRESKPNPVSQIVVGQLPVGGSDFKVERHICQERGLDNLINPLVYLVDSMESI